MTWMLPAFRRQRFGVDAVSLCCCLDMAGREVE
jgi:hypothetical protein